MLARMPHPYGEADARRFIARARAADFPGAAYALTVAETGAFVGCASLEGAAEALELGYWLGEPHWRKGYATEAAHALVDLAFRATPADAVSASCRVMDAASRRVLHKSGFQYGGQGMMTSLTAGRVPVERYRLDRRTWIGLRSWNRL
jgi:RimJ/RimL family protein N-acetyltransferase